MGALTPSVQGPPTVCAFFQSHPLMSEPEREPERKPEPESGSESESESESESMNTIDVCGGVFICDCRCTCECKCDIDTPILPGSGRSRPDPRTGCTCWKSCKCTNNNRTIVFKPRLPPDHDCVPWTTVQMHKKVKRQFMVPRLASGNWAKGGLINTITKWLIAARKEQGTARARRHGGLNPYQKWLAANKKVRAARDGVHPYQRPPVKK